MEFRPCGHVNPSHFRKIIWLPVECRVELCTSTTVIKYWKGIASSYVNDMFMPSLNNGNTRSQIALDIPLCRIIKGEKSMSFLGPKIWNKVSWSIKTVATTSSFMHRLKKEVLSKLQECAILLILLLLLLLLLLFFNFLKVHFCFYYISLRSLYFSRAILMEIRTILDLFEVNSAIFDLEVYFYVFYLFILYLKLTKIIQLNIFYNKIGML